MKIISLTAENIKRLKAVHIEPGEDQSMVIVSGKNDQGKTSVIDSIWYALGGKDATKDAKRPVRDGAEEASVTVDMGDLIVGRKWTSNEKSYLKVEGKEGQKFSSPQKMLDELVGRLTFDPLEFTRMNEKEQRATLLGAIELPFDLDELEAKKLEAFNMRTAVNREAKSLEAQLAAIPKPAADVPDEEVSAADVLARLKEAQEKQRAVEDRQRAFETMKARYAQTNQEIDELKQALAEKEKLLKVLSADGKALKAELENAEEVDLSFYQTELDSLEETNRAVREKQKHKELQARAKERQEESKRLTKEIDTMEEAKVEAVKNAKLPMEGVSVDDSGVTFEGYPLKQCSGSVQLKVSMAMAMAVNPKLRVMLIRDGNLLDSENMGLVTQMAQENDVQVWMERVEDDGGVGIVIEDGEVKSHGS